MKTPQSEHGFVIFVDIVGYSIKLPPEQYRCATYLMQGADTSRFVRHMEGKGLPFHANTTGDGFVLMCAGLGSEPYRLLDFAHEIFRCAKRFTKRSGSKKNEWSMDVRIGIHAGEFFFKCPAFRTTTALGTGVNMAARICGLADAGQVVVSSTFADLCRDFKSEDPKWGQRRFGEQWVARVKHDVPVGVRQYSFRDADGRVTFGTTGVSRARKRFIDASADIQRRLLYIVKELAAHCETTYALTPAQTLFRGSLLTVIRTDRASSPRVLRVSEFRCLFNGQFAPRSSANYPLDPPKGLPAFCFTEDQALSVTDLPVYDPADPAPYAARFKRYGLTEADFDHEWTGRPARAFLVVPVRCLQSGITIVLSIDSMNPLWPQDSGETSDILDRMRKSADLVLAPTWDLWLKT